MSLALDRFKRLPKRSSEVWQAVLSDFSTTPSRRRPVARRGLARIREPLAQSGGRSGHTNPSVEVRRQQSRLIFQAIAIDIIDCDAPSDTLECDDVARPCVENSPLSILPAM
jgi:hypothetical protein